MRIDSTLNQLYQANPMYQELFPKQLEFLLHPNRFVAGLTGSRSGKTTACAVYAAEDLSKNVGIGLYVARTDSSVRDIFMPIIKPLLMKYNIKARVTSDEVTFSNGSRLLVLGANHPHKIENFRGMKLRFAIVDECASFNQTILNYFIDEILIQRLSDLQGKLFLISTPAAHCSGLFYDVTTLKERGWGVVKWSVFDNPHMKEQAQKDVELYMMRKQCGRNDAKLLREYDGTWAKSDTETLVRIPTLEDVKYVPSTWRTVLGVDFGFNDKTAFSIIGWERNNPKAYVLETFGVTGAQVAKLQMGMVTYLGNVLNELKKKYSPVRIVGDPAGASKIMMDEFLYKHKVFMEVAVKKDKAHYIEIMNDAIINQKLVLVPGTTKELQKEMAELVWNDEHTREREGLPCDHFDATLYAWREALAHTEKIPQTYKYTAEDRFMKQVEEIDRRAATIISGDDNFDETANFLNKNTAWFNNEGDE